MTNATTTAPSTAPLAPTTAATRADTFALIELHADFLRLRERLRAVRGQLDEARSYLATPGGNQLLGRAQVERVRDRHSAALAALHAARREAIGRLDLARTKGRLRSA